MSAFPEASPEKDPERTSSPKGKRKIDTQIITTIALTIISLCALMVSLQQTRILSEQQRVATESAKAQLWPFLELGISKGFNEQGINRLRFMVGNSGTGPAIVEGVRMTYLNRVYTNWWDLLEQIPMADSVETTITNSPISSRVIQAGEEYDILALDHNLPLMTAVFEYFSQDNEAPYIEVYYRSVFDERWLIKGPLFGPFETITVEVPTVPEEEQFIN